MRARALLQLFAAELHHMANADFQPRLTLLGYGWLVTVSVATYLVGRLSLSSALFRSQVLLS